MITVVTDFEHLLFPFYCIFCGGNASKSWVMVWTSFPEHTCDEYLQPKGTRKPFVFIGDFCVFRRHFSLFFKWVSSVEMNLKHFVVLKATCWSFHWYKHLIDNFFFAFPILALGTINNVFDWHIWVIFLYSVKLRAKRFLDQLKSVSCQKSFSLFPKFWGYSYACWRRLRGHRIVPCEPREQCKSWFLKTLLMMRRITMRCLKRPKPWKMWGKKFEAWHSILNTSLKKTNGGGGKTPGFNPPPISQIHHL